MSTVLTTESPEPPTPSMQLTSNKTQNNTEENEKERQTSYGEWAAETAFYVLGYN